MMPMPSKQSEMMMFLQRDVFFLVSLCLVSSIYLSMNWMRRSHDNSIAFHMKLSVEWVLRLMRKIDAI